MGSSSIRTAAALVAFSTLLLTATNRTTAQEAVRTFPDLDGVPDWLHDYRFERDSFTFVRVRYASTVTHATWQTDYPDADLNLSGQLAKLTSLRVADPQVLRLTEVTAREHPFLYLSEPASMRLSEAEAEALRKYLTSGGFLMIDDFWGEREWQHVKDELARVFPDRTPTELPLEHPLFHCVFDLQEKPQVPSIQVAIVGRKEGITRERADARDAHYRGIVDNKGRIMVLLCHNTDLGDGWERTSDDAWYAAEFSAKRAFPMGINAIFYALTH